MERYQIVISTTVAAFAWLFNEWRKRALKEREFREANYCALVGAVYPIVFGKAAPEDVDAFTKSFLLAWFYSPRSIIESVYDVMEAVRSEDSERKSATFGNLLVSMRRELRGPLRFVPDDVRSRAFRNIFETLPRKS